MSIIYTVYDQLAQLIAQIEPQQLLAMRANEETQQRFNLLVQKSNDNSISITEKDELDHFIVLERLFRLAKMRADGLKTLSSDE